MDYSFIADIEGFDWDAANRDKNWVRHHVSVSEAEEVFLNTPLFFFEDSIHSGFERRILALGKTGEERRLSIVFTIRNKRIRVISARDMSKKERVQYEESTEEDSSL